MVEAGTDAVVGLYDTAQLDVLHRAGILAHEQLRLTRNV
jgi:hypothetical protein